LWVNPEIKSLKDIDVSKLLVPDDIGKLVKLFDYQHHPSIRAKMAV
jgi:thymidylate synthase